MPEGKKWVYFSDKEIVDLDTELVAMLDMARHKSGVPYIITSGYRDPEKNYILGGVSGSSHEKGFAVDLLCRDSQTMWRILNGLISVGFKRIGVYFMLDNNVPYWTHVHCDIDQEKPQEVCFVKFENMPGQVNT